MPTFEYRTFLLPQLMVKLGAIGGVAPDRDYVGNDFMAGEIAAENANQLLSFVHSAAVLLNLAGYQLEAIALAAKDSTRSAGLYIPLARGEYTTVTAATSDPNNALKQLIGIDFPRESDLCLALRLTPRPRWWQSGGSAQYFTLEVNVNAASFGVSKLNQTQPAWLQMAASASGFPETVGIHHVLNSLNDVLEDLRTAVASALASEWKSKSHAQRGGLLKYLCPDEWGDAVEGGLDELKQFDSFIRNTASSVYGYLESLSQVTFQDWLLTSHLGSFKETFRLSNGNRSSPGTIAEFTTAVERVFVDTHSIRDWITYGNLPTILSMLNTNNETTHYTDVLMMLEELTVVDMLGKVRQTPSGNKQILPFDITGHYEQVVPPDAADADTNPYDLHTLQLNQAGVYAQGFWQVRQPIACADTSNLNSYLRFAHFRFCLSTLPGQTYDQGQDEIFMRIFRWTNTNMLLVSPYIKPPAEAQPEDFCNDESAEEGTLRIAKTAVLPVDALTPDPAEYDVNLPDYGVELEITIGSETIWLRRLSPNPYIAEADLIEAPEAGRVELVIAQRFPLHSLDKVRILAAIQHLIEGLEADHEAFASNSYIPTESATAAAIAEVDLNFAKWLARYACVTLDPSPSIRAGPQLEQIRRLIVQFLAQKHVLNDANLEALTLLTVFLTRPIHNEHMPYTRKLLEGALPPRTPEMENAVDWNSAGLHAYEWGTNGLGERVQGQGWDFVLSQARKGIKNLNKLLEIVSQIQKNVTPVLGIEANIFLLDIKKLSPLTDSNGDPYPGWEPGENHRYLAIQWGLSASPPGIKGLFAESNSTQIMYAPINWDPGDFSGVINTWSASAGIVIDLQPTPFGAIDINSWLERKLQNSTAVQMLAEFLEFDPNNLKLGLSLSATVFFGTPLDGETIVSKGLNWVDYNYGFAYIFEAVWTQGIIIHVPEFINGTQATAVSQALSPVVPVPWRIIASSFAYETSSDIDVWELTEDDQLALRALAAEYLALFRRRTSKLTITGHASPIGTEQYNLWLSQKRAQAIYDYLRSLISDDEYAILRQNTTIQGYGEYYANMLGAAERDPSWQIANIYLNGHLVAQLGEGITP